jgi:hypothetical protein
MRLERGFDGAPRRPPDSTLFTMAATGADSRPALAGRRRHGAAANHLNRRFILKGASALGAAGGLAALPVLEIGHAQPAHRTAQGPAGSWVATVTIAGSGAPPPFQVLRTYADGGGYIETSSNSKNPQAPDSSGHGAWVSAGATDAGADGTEAEPRTFAVTFLIQRFDANGNLIGSIKVRETGTLNKTGDTYSALGKFEFLDLLGHSIASGLATAQATRIKVEPL